MDGLKEREEQAGDPDGLTHDALERDESVHAGAAPAASPARESRRCRATDRGARRQAGHGARDAVARALDFVLATPVSHPIFRRKPNASHMCARITISHI
jgi:hypothetical protein